MNLLSNDNGDIPDRFSEEVVLEKSAPVVWRHLVSHHEMRKWLGGDDYSVEVDTTWTIGSAIVIRGRHHLPFENRGEILAFRPCKELSFTHLSSLSRLPDQPSSYTKLSFALEAAGSQTILKFEASGFPTMAIYRHLHFYWMGTLAVFKRYTESR
ncbi:SRPBCC family protein [Dyella tabacisoli]|nr:SRPBCC domain-containing protein [Dyella tabacisoli]